MCVHISIYRYIYICTYIYICNMGIILRAILGSLYIGSMSFALTSNRTVAQMSQGFHYGLVSVVMSPWGSDLSVAMVANNIHHGSCGNN